LEISVCPALPAPMFWNAPVDVVPPAIRPYAVVDEIPVPPKGTPTTEPFHVPPVIVPPETVNPLTAVADSAPPVMVAVLIVPVAVRLPVTFAPPLAVNSWVTVSAPLLVVVMPLLPTESDVALVVPMLRAPAEAVSKAGARKEVAAVTVPVKLEKLLMV